MSQKPRGQKVLFAARRIYHALPLTASAKLKLRRLLAPYLHATVDIAAGKGVVNALSRIQESHRQLVWGGARERAFQRALTNVAQQLSEYGPISHVIVLPFLATGGAERVALNFASAIKATSLERSVLIIVADRPLVSKNVELPGGVALLVLDSMFDEVPTYEHKQTLLEDLTRAIRPHALHNINSEVAWQLIVTRGDRLAKMTRLFASIFAFQFTPDGRGKIGYAAYFLKPGLPNLHGLLSDNQRFVRDAVVEYALTTDEEKKLHAVYNPVRVNTNALVPTPDSRLVELASRSPSRRLRILWAGRLDEEKRIDLLVELAKAVDFADFEVYGQAVVNDRDALPKLPNLYYKGPFKLPEELVKDVAYDAFVFTSRWEGMPNILLEVGSLGLPVIAPTVGGVGELISTYTGYPLSERPNVAEYINALERVRSDPGEAAQKARTLIHLIERRHSWEAFTSDVHKIPGYIENNQVILCVEKS